MRPQPTCTVSKLPILVLYTRLPNLATLDRCVVILSLKRRAGHYGNGGGVGSAICMYVLPRPRGSVITVRT